MMKITRIGAFVSGVVLSATVFLAALLANEVVFPGLAFITGVNWIYLPAGIRLLCTLLFAEAGAVGLLIASWFACVCYFFPGDIIRSAAGAVIAAVAPYLSYLLVERRYGLASSLKSLSGLRLLTAAVLYAFAGSTLHHLWFWLSRDGHASMESWFVMFIGDFGGTVIILYFFRMLIALFRRVFGGALGRSERY